MRSFQDLSIRQKLTLLILLTSSVALFLACTAFVSYEPVTFRDGITYHMSDLAGVIGANSAAALIFDDRASAEETLSALTAEDNIVSAYVFAPDGRVFARYVRAGADGRVPPPRTSGGRAPIRERIPASFPADNP